MELTHKEAAIIHRMMVEYLMRNDPSPFEKEAGVIFKKYHKFIHEFENSTGEFIPFKPFD